MHPSHQTIHSFDPRAAKARVKWVDTRQTRVVLHVETNDMHIDLFIDNIVAQCLRDALEPPYDLLGRVNKYSDSEPAELTKAEIEQLAVAESAETPRPAETTKCKVLFDVQFSRDGEKFQTLISYHELDPATTLATACAGWLGQQEKTKYWRVAERMYLNPQTNNTLHFDV